MSRLSTQWQRLLAPQRPDDPDAAAPAEGWPGLVDAEGRVRALVLELARPANWALLAPVWQGVQVDLGLPAPAIAVNGRDGYQLWFSLAQPLPVLQGNAFLAALRSRYLSDVAASRVTGYPRPLPNGQPATHAGPVPALQADGERWSAFVAPDLAPMFNDEPWLDIPPNPDGQAELLARLASMAPAAFDHAMAQLASAGDSPSRSPALASAVAPAGARPDAEAGMLLPPAAATPRPRDPKGFLLDVMRDEQVALALRIEAAKALLPHFNDPARTDPEDNTP